MNCTMPALVNSSVGSLPGTRGELATTSWPCPWKNSRNAWRSSLLVMRFIRDCGACRWISIARSVAITLVSQRLNGYLYLLRSKPRYCRNRICRAFSLKSAGKSGRIFAPYFSGQCEPVLICFDQRIVDGGRGDAALPQLQPNTDGTFSLVDSRLDETLCEALIALQTVLGEAPYFGG